MKTTEGHIGLFTSTELQKDLHCNLCDFKATCAAKLKRHMTKHNPKPAKVKEKCQKCDKMFMFYQKKGLGSVSHIKRSRSSIVQFHVLHARFSKSSDLQLRKLKKKISIVDICYI